jgi:hypothetical protein
LGGDLIERWLAPGCSDPLCGVCVARRRRREVVLAGVVGGAVATFLLASFLLILQAVTSK